MTLLPGDMTDSGADLQRNATNKNNNQICALYGYFWMDQMTVRFEQ